MPKHRFSLQEKFIRITPRRALAGLLVLMKWPEIGSPLAITTLAAALICFGLSVSPETFPSLLLVVEFTSTPLVQILCAIS
jgi:hypothetical protein